jgi:hypothetical protein
MDLCDLDFPHQKCLSLVGDGLGRSDPEKLVQLL